MNEHRNELVSSLTHGIGLIFAIAGLPILLVGAARFGTTWHMVSFSIFGGSLILLYLASVVYHFLSQENRFKKLFQKIDHAMIFILIAGTYTPIALVPLRGGFGWSIFGIIWGMAVVGIFLKIIPIKLPQWFSVTFYLVMGWLVIVTIVPLIESLSLYGFLWLFVGGIFYTIGTLFLALEKKFTHLQWFGMHEAFHLFVVAGSASHFWLMYRYILAI